MTIGNINFHRGPRPYNLRARDYSIPSAELDLSEFTDLEAWMQPDQGNVLATAPNLHVFSRLNTYDMRASGAGISVGTGLTGGVAVVDFVGAAPADHTPFVVENLKLGGHYMLAGLWHFDAGATMGNTQTMWGWGINNTASNLHIFQQSGVLRVRHGQQGNDHASVSEFSAGDTALVMSCYDADSDEIKAYVNSLTPVSWEETDASGPVGGDMDLRIGSQWNNARSSAIQLFEGSCRASWIARAPWGRAEYDDTRNKFMTKIAAYYANDITLA